MKYEILDLLDQLYPADLVDHINGRVHISITNCNSVTNLKNEIISNFTNRETTLKIIMASCLVPGWAGFRKWDFHKKNGLKGLSKSNIFITF